MHIDEDTHLPSDKQKEKSVPQEKRAPIKLSLFRQPIRTVRKNKARRPRFPFQQNYNVK